MAQITHLTREQERKAAELREHGFTIGKRNPLINTAFQGRYMVAVLESWDGRPTEDARPLPFATVGADLGELIDSAYSFEFG
jgi:hypothetical protein